MTCGRYISKCKHEEITDNVFALGGMSPAFIEHKTGCISKTFLFQQIQMNRDIINSKSYLNISRGNSYTVLWRMWDLFELRFTSSCFCHAQMFHSVQMNAPAGLHITLV